MVLFAQGAGFELAWYWWVLIAYIAIVVLAGILMAMMPGDARWTVRHAQFLVRRGYLQRAEETLLAMLQRLPPETGSGQEQAAADRWLLTAALDALRRSPSAFANGIYPGAPSQDFETSPDGDTDSPLLELRRRASLAGHADEAESLWDDYVEAAQRLTGDHSSQHATARSDRAILLESIGRYAEAKRDYEAALRIWEQNGEQPFLAVGLINAGDLLWQMGEYDNARSHLTRALALLPRVYGGRREQASEESRCRLHLGSLHEALGELDAAIGMFTQAHQLALLGHPPGDWRTGSILRLLSRAEWAAGQYDAAETHAAEAMAIKAARFGWATPLTNRWRDICGLPRLARGDWSEAIANLQAAHEARVTLREHSLEAIKIQDVLGDALAGAGRHTEALAIKQEVSRHWDQFGASVFEAVPEPCRMSVLSQLARSQASFVSLVLQRFAANPHAVRSAFEAVCRRKGLGLELMCLQRDAALLAGNSGLAERWERLAAVRRRLAKHYLEGATHVEDAQTTLRLDAWKQELRQLDTELAAGVPALKLQESMKRADASQLAQKLPEGSVLVELLRLNVFDFQAVAEREDGGRWSPPHSWQPARYLAFVLLAADPDHVEMIDLGEADPIDRMIVDFRSGITGEVENRAGRDLGAAPANPACSPHSSHGSTLRASVFDKLVPALAGCKRMFIAPDGDLARLPFEALPTKGGRCLIDDYQISYVATGRDLLRFGAMSNRPTAEPLVFADPDFDLNTAGTPTAAAPDKSLDRHSRDLARSLSFGPLPGTRREGQRIAAMLRVKPWLDVTALESRLKACRSPRILHLATHGFFLADQKRDPNKEFRDLGASPSQESGGFGRLSGGAGLENPLLRSGLALAGANTWLQNGNLPAEAEDGLLTAEDVSGLDLLDTDLVVLSACETGLGEVHVGEGVFGLRRAFVLAGAKTLIMSLWKVPDQQTQELMEDFYSHLLGGKPRAEALRQAQLALKARYPNPLYWGAFICQGEPGPLHHQTNGVS